MPASPQDKFKKVGANTVTSLAAPGKNLGATSINVGSTTNYPTDTGLVIGMRVVDSNGNAMPGTYTEWNGMYDSPTSLTIENTPVYGTDQVYGAGATTQVFLMVSSSLHNQMIDGLLVSHDQDGKLKAGAISNSNMLANNTVTTAAITDASVTPVKLQSGTGTDWAWDTFTPTLSGQFADAKWNKNFKYKQTGKTVNARFSFIANANTPMSGSGVASFTLPVSSISYPGTSSLSPVGRWYGLDKSADIVFMGDVLWTSTTTVALFLLNAANTYLSVNIITSSVPITWAIDDEISGFITYEAA